MIDLRQRMSGVQFLLSQPSGWERTACRGRVILADDMGLGKTVQALAATEVLRRRRGFRLPLSPSAALQALAQAHQ